MNEWRERRAFYLQQGRGDEQKHEDMLAGRILRGLGITSPQRHICHIEQRVLGYVRKDQPMWPRARDIFVRLLAHGPYRDWAEWWQIAAVPEVKEHAEALERLTETDWRSLVGMRPLLFARVHNTCNCYTYTTYRMEELSRLHPPFTVHPDPGYPEWLTIRQEVAHFVQQFGPYRLLETDEQT
jgi:hypothetical protein